MSNYQNYSRREIFNFLRLATVFLLASCTKVSKNIVIGFQKSFFPESFNALLPKTWEKENINFEDIYNYKNVRQYNNLDYLMVNDGWINKIKFEDFKDLDIGPLTNFNVQSKKYLSTFDLNIRNKLFPIGVIPYAVVVKKNLDIENMVRESWDFLLSEDLKGKILLPNSPRIILSIAEKIDEQKALNKLINQKYIYDDKNALDWLLNSKAVVGIMPYSLCKEILKLDSRFTIVFPRKGVPLIWQFIMCKSNSSQKPMLDWINSLNTYDGIRKLEKDGWYLPFKDKYVEDQNIVNYETTKSFPSKECWQNSWSLSPLNNKDKSEIELLWKKLLTP